MEQDVTKCLIAYFDILGYSNIVKNLKKEDEKKFLELINGCVDKIYDIFNDNEYKKDKYIKFYINSFSDNFLISMPLHENVEIGLCCCLMFRLLREIQIGLIIEFQIFIRGSIIIDDIFVSNRFVYGKGIIKAYELENSIAIYPRLIIETSVILIYKNYLNSIYMDEESRGIGKLIKSSSINIAVDPNNVKKDFDGIFFINYLSTTFTFCGDPYIRFNNHKVAIVQNLIRYCNNMKIAQKYLWCQNYHNNMASGKRGIGEIFPQFIIGKSDLPEEYVIDN